MFGLSTLFPGLDRDQHADPDGVLVGQARQGSPLAFERLVLKHQNGIRAFLRRISGPDADDLAQETFLTAWKKLHQWRGQGSFKSWLYSIAWRTALSARRATQRRETRDHTWHMETDSLPDVQAGTDARLDLDRVLAALPEDQRAVLAMCYGAGMSHGEAAAALSLPLGTVKSHAARGRDKALALLTDLHPHVMQARITP
jgi:RNA polymerase sigma factor (sigma-70 family)